MLGRAHTVECQVGVQMKPTGTCSPALVLSVKMSFLVQTQMEKWGERRIKTILKTCLFTNVRQVGPGVIKISQLSLRRLCCLPLVQLQKKYKL